MTMMSLILPSGRGHTFKVLANCAKVKYGTPIIRSNIGLAKSMTLNDMWSDGSPQATSKLMPLPSLVDMCRKFIPSAGVLLHFAFMAHKQILSRTSSETQLFPIWSSYAKMTHLIAFQSWTCIWIKMGNQVSIGHWEVRRTAPSIRGICSRTSKAPLKNSLIPKASDMACLDQAKTKRQIIQLPHQILAFVNACYKYLHTFIVLIYIDHLSRIHAMFQ